MGLRQHHAVVKADAKRQNKRYPFALPLLKDQGNTKYSRDSPRMRCGEMYWIEAALYSNCVSGKTLKVRAAPPPRAQTRGPTVAEGICWIEATLYKGHGSCATSRWPDRPTWHAAHAMPQDINPEAAKLAPRHASPELALQHTTKVACE